MTLTIEEVLDVIEAYETDYEKESKRLGAEALEHLEIIIRTAEPIIASKAAYMAALIPDKRSLSILKDSARSESPIVRLAVANASRHLEIKDANDALKLLSSDENLTVRKRALKRIQERIGDR